MHRFAVIYSFVAIWAFGWLAGSFGLISSIITLPVLLLPAVSSWRMICAKRPIKRHDPGYIVVITLLTIGLFVFIVGKWYELGMDRRVVFNREYALFRRYVMNQPEYKDVEISYGRSKSGMAVSLRGTVGAKISHDSLIETMERMIWNNGGGYHDGVKYPGKPDR